MVALCWSLLFRSWQRTHSPLSHHDTCVLNKTLHSHPRVLLKLLYLISPSSTSTALLSGDGMESELEKLHHACKEWGFFQVRMYSTHLHKGLLANWTLQIKTHTKKSEVARSKKIHETPCKDLFCFVFRFSIHPIIEFSRLWVILDKPR